MNLLDLPDEILLFILKKINVVDALFRQSGLHHRLDQLLFDRLYVHELNFTIKSWNDSIASMDNFVIDRVCEKILPYIKYKIIKLTLDPNASERVLCAVDYPNVSSLSLLNFSKKTLIQYFTENPRLIQLMNDQITHFNVLIDKIENENDELNLFEFILSLSKCLIDFTLHQSYEFQDRNILISPLSTTVYPMLTKLNIQLNTFEECLFLFDGRFPSLSHTVVYINKIFSASSSIDNQIKLLKLKHFSLTSYIATYVYNDFVVPFLQRMPHLEELSLFLTVKKRDTLCIVDGTDLKNNILNHLSQLKTFHFSIYTYLYQFNDSIPKENNYPSNDNIQRSFMDNKFRQVGSSVHHGSAKTIYRCHVYSLPFQFQTFMKLRSSFTSGIFTNVRTLVIDDYVSWDCHFFRRVNQSFPFIEILMIWNSSPMENKSQLNDNFKQLTFSKLHDLCISSSLHIDYIQQLLSNRYTCLPCLYKLEIEYEQLITLTNNFNNNPTEFNCLRVQTLIINGCFVRPQNFSQFFPLL